MLACYISKAARGPAASPLLKCSNFAVYRRNLHVTAVARQNPSEEDSDDLFSSGPEERTPKEASRRVPLSSTAKLRGDKGTSFENLVGYVAERTGKKRAVKAGQVRQSAWLRLFQLASTPEQLEQVSQLFSRWRDSGKEFRPSHAEAFVRRCEELKCPPLALKVFGDRTKYGFGLTSLFAARHLLHSLHVNYPLEDTMTAAALFGVYKHPPVSSDLVACSMLTSACLKEDSKNSRAVATALLPQLKKLLGQCTPPALPQKPEIRARYTEKPAFWLWWTLEKIEIALKKNDKDFQWIRQWRGQSKRVTRVMVRRSVEGSPAVATS